MESRKVVTRRGWITAALAALLLSTAHESTAVGQGQTAGPPQASPPVLDLPENEEDLRKYLQALASARALSSSIPTRPTRQFTFALAGVRIGSRAEDRSVGFFKPNGDSFSFTCGD